MAYNVAAELFAEWAVGLVIIAVRLYAKWATGKRHFWWDDRCLGLVVVSGWMKLSNAWVLTNYRTDFLDIPYVFPILLHWLVPFRTTQAAPNTHKPIQMYMAPTLVSPPKLPWRFLTTRYRPFEKAPYMPSLLGSLIIMAWSFKGVLMFLYTQLTYVYFLLTGGFRLLESEWVYGNIVSLPLSVSSASLPSWPLFSSIFLSATRSITAGRSSHMEKVSIQMATTHRCHTNKANQITVPFDH